MRCWRMALFFGGGIACAGAALAAPQDGMQLVPQAGMPQALLPTAKCMLNILKADPGVTYAKLEVSKTRDAPRLFLRYRAQEAASWVDPYRIDVVFEPKNRDPGAYQFQVIVSGLAPEGSGGPDVHVTDGLTTKWEKSCNAHVAILMF